MSNSIIEVNNLSKKIKVKAKVKWSLKIIKAFWKFRPFKQKAKVKAKVKWSLKIIKAFWKFRPCLTSTSTLTSTSFKEEFWALKDVSFTIEQGDRVGIIGRNGAGKSTLLKILSRITEPTSGEIKIKGRVASLLELRWVFIQNQRGANKLVVTKIKIWQRIKK